MTISSEKGQWMNKGSCELQKVLWGSFFKHFGEIYKIRKDFFAQNKS